MYNLLKKGLPHSPYRKVRSRTRPRASEFSPANDSKMFEQRIKRNKISKPKTRQTTKTINLWDDPDEDDIEECKNMLAYQNFEVKNKLTQRGKEFIKLLEDSKLPNKVKFDYNLQVIMQDLIVLSPMRLSILIEELQKSIQLEEDIKDKILRVSLFWPRPRNKKRTLLLDLDCTMIYATTKAITGYDYKLNLSANKDIVLYISLRPYLIEFLEFAKLLNFELAVFSSAQNEYCKKMVEFIDPERKFFSQVFHRASCLTMNEKDYVKDLRFLLQTGRKLDDILLVDNSTLAMSGQINNGIKMSSYLGDKSDMELIFLGFYLNDIPDNMSCLKYNMQQFRMHDIRSLVTQ